MQAGERAKPTPLGGEPLSRGAEWGADRASDHGGRPPQGCPGQGRRDPHYKTHLRMSPNEHFSEGWRRPHRRQRHVLFLFLELCGPAHWGFMPLFCQAALMNRLQDGRGVRGIHLTDVSTFSFKSLLTLAVVCSLLTAWPGPGCSISEAPGQEGPAESTLARDGGASATPPSGTVPSSPGQAPDGSSKVPEANPGTPLAMPLA